MRVWKHKNSEAHGEWRVASGECGCHAHHTPTNIQQSGILRRSTDGSKSGAQASVFFHVGKMAVVEIYFNVDIAMRCQ